MSKAASAVQAESAGSTLFGDPGEEWVIDAYGCDPERLRDERLLRALLSSVIGDIDLHPLTEGFWHQFPGEAGVTGLVPLRESHLSLHTYPERALAAFNLYCCRRGCDWPWESELARVLGATCVDVRKLERGRGTQRGGAGA